MSSSPSSNMRRGKSDGTNKSDGMYNRRQQQQQQQRHYQDVSSYDARLFAAEEEQQHRTSTSSSHRYRLNYRDTTTYRSEDTHHHHHHHHSSFRSPLLSKSASSKQKVSSTSTSPTRRTTSSDSSKVPSSPSNNNSNNKTTIETTSQIVAAANAGLSESRSKIDNDLLPRRTLFSPSPNEKQQQQQQQSSTTATTTTKSTPKSSHKGPLNTGLLDLHKSPPPDDYPPSPTRLQQQQQQHRHHHSRSSSSRSYHPPPPPYYQSSSSSRYSSSSSSIPNRHHSMSYGDYSPAVLPDQDYYDMIDRRHHQQQQQQHHHQDRYHHLMSESTMLRSSRSFDRTRASSSSGPDSDPRTTRRRHLMDYGEDRYAYDTAATRGTTTSNKYDEDLPPNTATTATTTTASGNIPKPSPIYDRSSSSTSSSRRPFSNITNIPPRTSVEGERNPVASPEPNRSRYREDSSTAKPMDISTPSPKKDPTAANVSGSGNQQVSSAVAVSRRGGSKRKYDFHSGSSRPLSDEHSRPASSSAMSVRYCTPIVTDRHRASVIPEEEQQAMSASSSSSHHRDSKKFRSTTPQLLRYGAGGNTPAAADMDHLTHSPHDLYEGHLTPHNYREQYLDDTPSAGSSMRHHRYSTRKRMFHEDSLSSPQRAPSRNRDKSYGTPIMMHHGLESPGASAHFHRYPPHDQAAAQDISTGSRSRGYHQRKPSSAIDSSYSYLDKEPPYSRYHSVPPHSAYSSRHSMGFSPYPLDKRPVRNSQLDSAITAAVLDQEQLSSINPEQDQHHRYSSYEHSGGDLFKETKKSTSTKTTRRKKMYSDYVGVTYNKTHAKYQACITHYRKQHYLGRYKLAVDAARAYDESAKLLKGNGWKINFNSVEEYERAKAREIAVLAKSNKNIDIEVLTKKDNSKLVTHPTGHIQDSEYARALYAKARIEASTAKEKMNISETRAQQDQQSNEDRDAENTEDNLEGSIDKKAVSMESTENTGKTAISDKEGKGGAVSPSPVASEKAATQSFLGAKKNPASHQRTISKTDVHSISTSKSMNTPSSSNERYREKDKKVTESSTSDVMTSKFVSPSNISSSSMKPRKSGDLRNDGKSLSTKATTDDTKRKNIITPSTTKKSDSKPSKLSERDDIHSSDHDEDIAKTSSDEEEPRKSDEPLSKDKKNDEDDKSSDGNDGKKKGNGGTLAAASALISLVGN